MEDQEVKVDKRRKIVIGTMVVVVLFILPAGSWFYLQSGLNYRNKTLSELGDVGKITDFTLLNQNGLTVSAESMRGRISVVNFLQDDVTASRAVNERISKLHESFDKTDDVVFLTFIPTDNSSTLLQMASELGIKDHKQHFLLGAPAPEWQRLVSDVFRVENPGSGVALVDTSLSIRNYYDVNSNKDMGRLVEHIALIVPKQNRR